MTKKKQKLQKINLLLLLALGIFLIPFVASNGLQINNNETISLNKTYQENTTFQVNLTNTEPFNFYEIGVEEEFAEVTPFNLSSGETKIVTVTYTGDTDFNGVLTFRGLYETDLGVSNQTETVNINYEDGFDKCNLNLVVGDSIEWINNVNDYIKLVNGETGIEFETILEGQNKTKTFNTPESFTYYATRITKFTNTCKVEINDDEGLVHSFDYDDQINLDVKINYPNTNIEFTLLETNYTIEYNGQEEDILKLKNLGDNEAKNIHLDADWITFDEDMFDLSSGESKNIGYKINPQIFETNQTNKTHTINIEVSGNFETITKQINVFIPYKKLENIFTGVEVDIDLIRAFILSFCQDNQDLPECIFLDPSNPNFNEQIQQMISKNTLAELLQRYTEDKKTDTDFKKNQTETDILQTNSIIHLSENQNDTNTKIDSLEKKVDKATQTTIFFQILLLFIIGITFLYFIIKGKGKEDNLKKGEAKW